MVDKIALQMRSVDELNDLLCADCCQNMANALNCEAELILCTQCSAVISEMTRRLNEATTKH
jgi:hypothetical protein